MRARTAFLAASVVGALAMSGAVTGTTLARWQDSAPLPDVTLRSGSLGLSVSGARAHTLPGVTGLLPGQSVTSQVTLRNSAPGTTPVDSSAPARVRVASTWTDSPALGDSLRLQVGAATDCATPAGVEGPFRGYRTGDLTAAPLASGGAATVCVTIKLDAGAPLTAAGAAGTVRITFTAEQVRP